jgi:hypothetical protein
LQKRVALSRPGTAGISPVFFCLFAKKHRNYEEPPFAIRGAGDTLVMSRKAFLLDVPCPAGKCLPRLARTKKARCCTRAVDEIHEHAEEGGFFVTYEGIREGKSFSKIKFILVKTADRDDRNARLQGKA